MTVLFTSNRSLERAENIHAIYQAYNGNKEFFQVDPYHPSLILESKQYSLRVTDEFPSMSPGKCILVGHGIAGCKTVGLDQPHPYFYKSSSGLINYVVTTSEDVVDLVARQSGVPKDRVLPLGMPRTDVYFGLKKGDGKSIMAEKRAYLYAPTYRTAEETPLPEIDWRYIDRHLEGNELLVVKPHMLTKPILNEKYHHIVEISSKAPSTPYLTDCDVLITDYSSILIDAHLLGKPVVLFEKQQGYLGTRGMYFEYPSGYASRYCTTEKELIDTIRSANCQGEEDLQCLKRLAGACDGHSTERVIDLIRSMA